MITALLAVAIGADRFTPVKLVGALVAFAGVALIVGADTSVDLGRSLPGYLLTISAAVCWAVYTSFGARVLRRHSPLRTTTWAVVSGTIVLLPIGAGQLSTLADPVGVVWAAGAAILYSGILAAGLPNVAVFHAVKLLGPTRVTAFQFLVPALTVVLAAVFLAEPIRAAQVVGGVVIVGGVLLTRRETFRGSPLCRMPAGRDGH